MFNIKRTVYGAELYLAGVQGNATDRLCTCDNVAKAERMVVWLSALNSICPLAQVLTAAKAVKQVEATVPAPSP